jgi:murein DD-endopeptidase MepM/ murein hydrolase activator NlpD
MKFYRPCLTKRVTQVFGQNYNNYYAQLGLLGHNGQDLGCPGGEEVRCPTMGQSYVCLANESLTYGKRVVLLIQDKITGKWYKFYFGHLKDFCVKEGDYVDIGDLLGHTDNTGLYTTGNHLHFGVYECDAGGNVKNRDNGYDGAINPAEMMIDVYVLEALCNMRQQVLIIEKLIELYQKLIKKLKKQ